MIKNDKSTATNETCADLEADAAYVTVGAEDGPDPTPLGTEDSDALFTNGCSPGTVVTEDGLPEV